jgi:hypothetical protein
LQIRELKIPQFGLEKLLSLAPKKRANSNLKIAREEKILPLGKGRQKDGHISHGPFQGLWLHSASTAAEPLGGCWRKIDSMGYPQFSGLSSNTHSNASLKSAKHSRHIHLR